MRFSFIETKEACVNFYFFDIVSIWISFFFLLYRQFYIEYNFSLMVIFNILLLAWRGQSSTIASSWIELYKRHAEDFALSSTYRHILFLWPMLFSRYVCIGIHISLRFSTFSREGKTSPHVYPKINGAMRIAPFTLPYILNCWNSTVTSCFTHFISPALYLISQFQIWYRTCGKCKGT